MLICMEGNAIWFSVFPCLSKKLQSEEGVYSDVVGIRKSLLQET